MARKKKRKSCVNVNAIDKYLMQKKYTRESQENKTGSTKIKQPKIILRRININEKTDQKIVKRKSREKSAKPIMKKAKIKVPKTNQKVMVNSAMNRQMRRTVVEVVNNKKSVDNVIPPIKINKDIKNLKKKSCTVHKKVRGRKPKSVNKRNNKQNKLLKPVENLSEKIQNKENCVKTVHTKPQVKINKANYTDTQLEKSEVPVEVLIKKKNESDENDLLQKCTENTNDFDVGGTKMKSTEDQELEPTQFVISSVAGPCLCDTIDMNKMDYNSDFPVMEERNPLTKKYQPYMERIKLLTAESIKKYIIDNRQYYVDLRNQSESNIKNFEKKYKKRKEEFKDNFKCNPFNSAQQITMFNTLREIFNIPQNQFKECRNFFTVLIPEISCQLFAETFRIKVSFAPRLIKKLYPNPVCPV